MGWQDARLSIFCISGKGSVSNADPGHIGYDGSTEVDETSGGRHLPTPSACVPGDSVPVAQRS